MWCAGARAALLQAAVGGAQLPTAVVMDETPALLEWQVRAADLCSDVYSHECGSVQGG